MNSRTRDEISSKVSKRVLSYIRDEIPTALSSEFPTIINHSAIWRKCLDIKRLDPLDAEQLFQSSCYMKDDQLLKVCSF